MALGDPDIDQLTDDQDEIRNRYVANQPPAPTIARPQASSMPAIAVRPIGTPAQPQTPEPGSTGDLEARADAIPSQLGSSLRTATQPSPASPAAGRIGREQTELDRLQSTGSGISQIKNPFLRTAARGLNTIGEIGSVFLPQLGGVMRAIPGTEEHHNSLVGKERALIGEDTGQQEKEAQTAKAGADTEEAQARAHALENPEPKPKEEKWSQVTGWTDMDGTPLIHEENSGQFVRASDHKPATGFKPVAPKTDKPDNPEQQLLDAESALSSAKTPEDKQAAQANLDRLKKTISEYTGLTQKPERPGAGNARSDKSYTYNNDKLDKLGKPLEDTAARVGRLRDTLAQGTPQADALVAPELLSIMAGGQGSGLRMNEAEISRIVGGRSAWENLKANIQHWSTDPNAARSITPDQQKQIHALVDAVNTKLTAKQKILDDAREKLLDSDDPKEHRRIVTEAHRALTQLDEGGGAQNSGKSVSLAAAKQLSINKGKTDDEITADIKAHGHEVAP